MFLDSIFASEKTYTALVEDMQQTIDPATGTPGAKEWVTIAAARCVYWRGSMAKGFISEQFRNIVSGVALVKPSDVSGVTFQRDNRVTIKDGMQTVGVFSLVYADNIAGQNEVIALQLTEYKKI